MCGIVAYIGEKQAQAILLGCLSRLEYRGYDSCGIALRGAGESGAITVFKDTLRVRELAASLPATEGFAGIGHTRWATHGAPSRENAHPHTDCRGRFAVAHNGIITNYASLREELTAAGHTLASETDTEVIPHLIEKYYQGDLAQAVVRALKDLEGSYAIAVVSAEEPMLVAARKDSPLVVGLGDRANFVASDVPAMLEHTNRVIYLEEEDLAVITGEGVAISNNGKRVTRQENKVGWSVEDAKKGGYEHFMLKEIHEQPRVIRDTLAEYRAALEPIAGLALAGGRALEHMLILASGTSYHAALVGKYIIEGLIQIPVRVEVASEFGYSGRIAEGKKAVVITQSGETADALKVIRRLKDEGCPVITVTNVVGSSASRLADEVVYTRAGPEVSVPATKSFTAQLIALYWLALPHPRIDSRRQDELILALRQLPEKVQQVLDDEDAIAALALKLAEYEHAFFIGRGINYPVALEGALKMKEISYIHAEGYAAGELKHGPFALLDSRCPVVAILGADNTRQAMLSSIREVKARQSPVIALAPEGDSAASDLADEVLYVPVADPVLSPVVNTVALQLLAYHTARHRGCSIDFPRNLAKSVTVE